MPAPKAEGRHPNWAWAVPLASLVAALLLQVAAPSLLGLLRNATFDQYQRWHPRDYGDPPVRIVDIDEESLRRYGQWPWPRSRVAALVDGIQRLAPSAVAMDVMFSEADRTSPRQLLGDMSPSPAAARELRALPDHDEQLAQALSRSNVVVGMALKNDPVRAEAELAPDVPPELKARYLRLGGDPISFVPAYTSGVLSLGLLQHAAAGQGAITLVPDADGVVRKVPMLLNMGGTLVPSLSAEALRLAEHASNFTLRSEGDGGGLVDVRVGRTRVDTDAQGLVWVHYSAPRPERYIAAWKVLEQAVDAREIAGKVVLVGTSAEGLLDLRFSPRGVIVPGVEVHAQALEQILTHRQLTRPGWAPAVELLATLAGGIAVGTVAMTCGAATSLAAFLALAALLGGVAWQAFAGHSLLIDPTTTTLAWFAVFLPTTLMRHLTSERRQRWVRQAFARYVSPNLVDYLIEHPDALELGGRRQRCSFVFADLAGFTTLMETMDPAAAVKVLNAYLDRMIAIAFEHQGTLDRIVGDSVAIVFSAPVEQADHERKALQCALQMQAYAHAYYEELARQGIAFCETRIGVHTGEVTVGNFGGGTIFDYRALGDPVNTASRLEGANKYLGTLICVSEATLSACPDMPARPIGRLKLAGRSELIMVFEPMALAADAPRADPDYLRAYECLSDEPAAALEAFEALAARRPGDPLVALHLKRLRAGESGDSIELRRK